MACYAVPITFILAGTLGGNLFDAGMERVNDTTVVGVMTQPHMAGWLMLLQIANFGPYLAVFGVRCCWQRLAIGKIDLNIAAQSVATLLAADGAVAPSMLWREKTAAEGARLTRFLRFHEIVDVSKNKDRVWICGEARKELEKVN